ncbi:hypothetical protein COLO4_22298 [Corchorus olitorius]|uniref:Uncharacterized protein n=1 Tax=Corchorus olitorius TaxID=93759 RepID=A0A1R3IN02_9ROSI|nr:hypothetical protein COLO4_22298 [Corchorus olitorius]
MKISVAYTCWGIWIARCNSVIGHKQDEGAAGGSFEENIRWTKPVEGRVKINCYGASCQKSQNSGVGLVARDSIFESRVASLWKIKPIVTDIQNLLGLIHATGIRVIKRSANSAADWFARQARLKMSYVELGQHQPSSIIGIWIRYGVGALP